ncbi:DeoR/GlpR transcriptional regulator [Spirosoma aureum]|uniref:DeoR/GlpR transcriptional regulator n=2 Tax=Spirosoma aureum TaxID=2692134 RepID=A0A6G9AVT8_9BACT|nr:DeoR/GlpR transcriptional regulator [Spirosoma aureum]
MRSMAERHQLILQQLKEYGRVTIQELSDLMDVSGVTIRKDLKVLEDKSLIFRTRGGGSLANPYAYEKPVDEKALIKAEEKQKIAKAALTLINPHDSIIIGSGTTVFELARCLYPSKPLTVITPAVKVAQELSNRAHVEVLQLGGLIRPNSYSVVGSQAERMLENLSCGLLFIGVDGIDFDFGLSISNLIETSLNQKMIETAQHVAVMADWSKIGKRGIGKVGDLDQVHYFITDSGISSETVRLLEDRGIKVLIG